MSLKMLLWSHLGCCFHRFSTWVDSQGGDDAKESDGTFGPALKTVMVSFILKVMTFDNGHNGYKWWWRTSKWGTDLPAIDDNAAAWVDHQQQRSKMSSLWNGSRFNLFLIKISVCERRNWNSWNSLTFCNSDQQEVGEKGEEIAPDNNPKVLKFWKFNNFPW